LEFSLCVSDIAVLYLIKQPGVDIPVETGNWLVAKSSSVEAAIADLNALWVHHNEEMSPTSNEWPVLIRRIETSAKEVESLTKGYEGLIMPDHEHSVDLIKTAIINLKRLMLILADIRAEEYNRLWITRKYEVV
jgi:hypothetical protein